MFARKTANNFVKMGNGLGRQYFVARKEVRVVQQAQLYDIDQHLPVPDIPAHAHPALDVLLV